MMERHILEVFIVFFRYVFRFVGMYAYSGILSALLLRGKTGQGSRIDVSMLESLVEWMGYPMYYAFDGAAPPPRTSKSSTPRNLLLEPALVTSVWPLAFLTTSVPVVPELSATRVVPS